jgi:uncharacterized protein (TIGR00251 family)
MPDAYLVVRLTPGADRDEVTGWQGEELRLRLRARPVEGRANEALRRFLASQLSVAPSAIELVAGTRARVKRLRVMGLTQAELRQRLDG